MDASVEVLKNAWCSVEVDSVGLLIDGADYYRAFYHAAREAQHSILIAGWQFDSDVALLRGADAAHVEEPVTLRDFLNQLCERKPNLEIFILAWDFHVIFAGEREWMQTLRFDWSTNERLHFIFDAHHAPGGSHHQKFVVIDGYVSFLGGLDLCDHRWDESAHKTQDPLRMSRGAPHRPFHDIQLYLSGKEPAAAMTALFSERWKQAGGAPFTLPDGPQWRGSSSPPRGVVPLDARKLWLSRTDPLGTPGGQGPCREIEQQYLAAIANAERLLYIETQYLSSRVIADALETKLRDRAGPPIEIVIVVNLQGENFKEQTAVGLAQAENIGRLRDAAASSIHQLGIYYTLSSDGAADQITYIHSKLLIVDDRVLIVGSANLTNRSLSLDTELNATLVAKDEEDALCLQLAALRSRLLAEHSGGINALAAVPTLIAQLEEIAGRPAGPTARLRRHPSPTPDELTLLTLVDPQKLPFDREFCEDREQEGTFAAALKALLGLDAKKA